MNTERTFQLWFVIECPTADADALTAEIKILLEKELENHVAISCSKRSGTLVLKLAGAEKWIDSSHGKIRKKICPKRRSIRTADELGADLRRRAYELIAPVEEKLRGFINQAMTDVLGFSWWEELGEGKIKDDVDGVQKKSKATDLANHPIEFTQFDHLVDIITGDLAHWKLDRPLSPADIIDLLGKAVDLKGLSKELADRTTLRSIWDNVFAPLFTDQESWQKAKSDLQKIVIRTRHKVMHHRPMRLHEVDDLKIACERIVKTLEAKTREIKEPERKELRKTANDLMDFLKVQDFALKSFALPTLPMLSVPKLDAFRPTLDTIRVPPAGDLSAILRSMPDMSAFNNLTAQLNRTMAFAKGIENSMRLTEQLTKFASIPVSPFFETVPDELDDEEENLEPDDPT